MAFRVVDDFSTPWSVDASGLWKATADPNAANLGADGYGMTIVASPGSAIGSDPFVQRVFSPALDLTDSVELRLWLRADRPATGAPQSPFYLFVEAATDPTNPNPAWSRFIRIGQANRWELQRLYLADMPAALRGSVGVLRLRGLDRTLGFTAAVDDLQAGVPQAAVPAGACPGEGGGGDGLPAATDLAVRHAKASGVRAGGLRR